MFASPLSKASRTAVDLLLPQPCVVVNPLGLVEAASESALELLAAIDASIANGRLRCGTKSLVDLHDLLGEVARSWEPDAARLSGQFGRCTLHFVPWSRSEGDGRAGEHRVVVLSLRHRPAWESPAAALARSRGLTPAETQVLSLLCDGMCIKEIARQRACSVHTVRSQTASLLAKNGVRSQRELLSTLALPA